MADEKIVVSFNKPTPMWATWIFRVVFLLTTAATIIVAAEPDISDKNKAKVFIYLKALDFVIWGVGKGLGVEKKQFEG